VKYLIHFRASSSQETIEGNTLADRPIKSQDLQRVRELIAQQVLVEEGIKVIGSKITICNIIELTS
jgi:hypothetical protein